MFSIIIIICVLGGIVTSKDKKGSGGLATYVITGTFVFIPKNNVVNLFIGLPFERAL